MKTLLTFFCTSMIMMAQSVIVEADIDVASYKPNGMSWDIAGGAPDILLYVDGKKVGEVCRNQYRCEILFKTDKQKIYIEVYDKDLQAHDLIGKGECRVGSVCELTNAKVKLKRINDSQ